MYSVQMAIDNYDVLHNPKVREKYPILYTEVFRHDRISNSSWYNFSYSAYEEYLKYIDDKDIGYVS